jgi:hypothetical protein
MRTGTKSVKAKKTSIQRKKPAKLKPDCPMSVGHSYMFDFPRHNFFGVLSRLESRRLKVEKIRDLKSDPLDRVTVDIQPLLRRGRFMAIGEDLDTGEERSFYIESMRNITEIAAPISFRKVLTAYVVCESLIFVKQDAEAYAEAEATVTRRPVIIETVKLPTSLKRTLLRVVPPKPKRAAR